MHQRRTHLAEDIQISWPGKSEALAEATAPCSSHLKIVAGKSLNQRKSENFIIEGDNVDAMKLLLPEYAKAVRAIYIDPPYNTGNDFAYHDRRNHSAWLSMMLPRLLLAREMMAEDAAIFVSIDDHEVDKLRMVMSEVFGEENFVGQITVQSNPRGRQADKHFATVHEYLVVYARHHERCRLLGAQLTEDQQSEFENVDPEGRKYRLLGLRQRGAASLREDRPAMYYPVFVDPESATISLDQSDRHMVAVYPRKSTGQAGRWMWGQQRARSSLHLLEAKLIARRNEWDIFVRDYLDDASGNCRTRKLKTIWDDKELNYQNGKRQLKELLGDAPLDYPKPTALITKLIAMFEDRNGLFLDFFAGTGTVAHAVMEANAADGGKRRFGLIQLPEKIAHGRFGTIADVCRERVALAAELLNSNAGFKYYEVTNEP